MKIYLNSGTYTKTSLEGKLDLEKYILEVLAKETCCDKFIVLAKLTTAERNALTNVKTGTFIYNVTTLTTQSYNGTAWV